VLDASASEGARPGLSLPLAGHASAAPWLYHNRPHSQSRCLCCLRSCTCTIMQDGAEQLVWCKSSCGNNLHKQCFDTWARSKRDSGQEVTCIYCRAVWPQGKGGSTLLLQVSYRVNTGLAAPCVGCACDLLACSGARVCLRQAAFCGRPQCLLCCLVLTSTSCVFAHCRGRS
jgi:hypothetical protein